MYYISAPDGLAAIYVKPQSGQASMYYAHTDHLGSIVSLTDSAGVAVFKASYDAWGKQTVSLNTIGFYRGYTGHEHLPEFGLINMNGRLYDPVVGRFLSLCFLGYAKAEWTVPFSIGYVKAVGGWCRFAIRSVRKILVYI